MPGSHAVRCVREEGRLRFSQHRHLGLSFSGGSTDALLQGAVGAGRYLVNFFFRRSEDDKLAFLADRWHADAAVSECFYCGVLCPQLNSSWPLLLGALVCKPFALALCCVRFAGFL